MNKRRTLIWVGFMLMMGCSDPNENMDDPVLVVDLGQMEDMSESKFFDFVYTLPDIPIVDECDMQAEDLPDRFGIDLNCDGIDGDESRSVFVASYGDDSNDGSRYMPLKTIQAAIDLANQTPSKDWVLVQEGLYREVLQLQEGVNIAGGYELGWKRDGNGFAQVEGGNPTIIGLGIEQETLLMNLDVRPVEEFEEGRSSVVTMALEQSPGVVLERMFIVGGAGARGADGAQGAQGVSGTRGANGGNGKEDSSGVICSSNSRPSGGLGGVSACGGAPGGDGGRPGKEHDSGDTGTSGESTPEGVAGGGGGPGGASSRVGTPGDDGGAGVSGVPGVGASNSGSFFGYEWQGNIGGIGFTGSGGAGGGGGGGGGGGSNNCDSWGGTGGGGGSGGCGGEGGFGGSSGGASVALMLTDSDIVIRNCRIVIGQGGAGGDGGPGGFGGAGGPGGNGGEREDDSGAGGKGGEGGKGGLGGSGGGGAGGPAFGVFSNVALSVDPEETHFVEGSAGFGGSGSGDNGSGEPGVHRAIQIGAVGEADSGE